MPSKLPYGLEAILASESGGPLPRLSKNRRPFVQQTIEEFWREEERVAGHWHYSRSGLTARILAAHFAVERIGYVIEVKPGYGTSIRIEGARGIT